MSRIPAQEQPRLLVVVDTEEEFDWHAAFDRKNVSVAHLREVEVLQRLFDDARIRPTYAITYPVATQADGVEPLKAILARGGCELGAHLHPWVTPPFEEEVNARNSYPGNLPRDLERRKIEALSDAIESAFGVRPRAYKAGRYGFGPNTAATLDELAFDVDLSPCPAFDFSADGGPDWSDAPAEPRWIGPHGRLLSIPATGAFVGFASGSRSESSAGSASRLYRAAGRPPLAWLRARGILSRTGALERLLLSPEGYSHALLVRLTRALLARGVRTFAFTLHSPSIRPGCTPYVRNAGERVEFLDACRRYFEFFQGELGGVTMTATELLDVVPKRPERAPLPERA
jgi:hypothetical protein